MKPQRGDIWLVNFEPNIGAEIKKNHPSAVINLDTMGRLPLRIVVPFTDWKPHYSTIPWMA